MRKGKEILIFLFLWIIFSLLLSPSIQERKNQLKTYLQLCGISKDYIQSIFNDKRLALVFPPDGKVKNYFDDRLLGPKSVKRGKDFWQEHSVKLDEAVKQFPKARPEYIVSILRIETDLGGNIGNAPAVNYLYTWVVRDHAEQKDRDFAKIQLFHLLNICLKNGLDVFSIKGSYMGAIGYCQFLPENYEEFAVDGNGDGIIDLFNWDDVIMSTANYLDKFGFEYTYTKIMEALWQYNKGPYRHAVALYAYYIQLPD